MRTKLVVINHYLNLISNYFLDIKETRRRERFREIPTKAEVEQNGGCGECFARENTQGGARWRSRGNAG